MSKNKQKEETVPTHVHEEEILDMASIEFHDEKNAAKSINWEVSQHIKQYFLRKM